MRSLIAWNLMTLDGYFEGREAWDLSFHQQAWGEELETFSKEQGQEIGTLLFGRRTYDGMAAYWTSATDEVAEIREMMNTVPKAVVSDTLETAEWQNTRLLQGDGVDAVRSLKAENGKDIFVFGSAELLSALLDAGLVDEYRLCIAPSLIGAGNPLFKPGSSAHKLHLLEARALKTGAVLLRYGLDGGAM
jgi:dihydrofolate reductase